MDIKNLVPIEAKPITEETYDACWECGGMGEIVLDQEKCLTERCSRCGGTGEKPQKTENAR